MIKNASVLNNHRNLTSFDLRVELLFDAILENNTEDSDIVIKSRGLFYRKFSKDRMNVSLDALNKEIINIDISRDGFYDVLPERISHNSRSRELINDASQEFKIRKKEEKEARHFFNPIENELFRFRHIIEKYESDFFSKISSNGIADIIKMILVVENTIPDPLVVKIFYALLKQNKSSDQSIDSICKILEDMLNEKVSYHISNIKLEKGYDVIEKSTDLIMGINTTLESNQEIFLKKYNFSIGPLKNSEKLQNYFLNQTMEIFLTTFFNLFLPFHVQYSFKINLNSEDEQFELGQKNYKCRLGISTRL
ncbi:hypothetical protein [Flavobacterium sp.]|uniref:hypothetical protein n=1 Tax=Flavobacterium sp. TaxID=239 RepID=UPI00286E7AB7|nr:hypothetical protein [Flavobacterium sp.]